MNQQVDISQIYKFKYYSEHLLKIKTDARQLIPLKLNIEQERLHKIWEWQLRTTGMVRLLILKDRRIGVSTYVDGRIAHQSMTIPNTLSFIITHDKPSLAKLFNMVKLFWECLPPQFRPMKRNDNSTILTFENPSAKARIINPGLRSAIEVFSANTGTASRAGGYSLAHLSEVAFYKDAETLITSTVPAIQDVIGSVIVKETTGNGRQGHFYDQWQKAKKSLKQVRKLSNYYPVFFGFLSFPQYQKAFLNEKEKKDFLSSLDEEELYLQKKLNATPEQLNWRASKIRDFSDDVDKFHQEYPATDEDAFISKGSPYFSKRKLLQLLTETKPPLWRGDIDEFGFHENEEGPLKIWERPQPNFEYVLAADAGEGIEGGDFSTIEVLKVPKGNPLIKQVAEYKSWIDPVLFAGKIAGLGRWYNEGMAVPEKKHPGITTIAELKNIYSNIYQWEYIDRFKRSQSTLLGWETNISTKPVLCSYAATCLTAGILEINSEELIEEMLSFVRNTNNSGEADYECHDDLTMAYIIGLFCLANSYNVGSLLQQLGMFKDKEKVDRLVEKEFSSKSGVDFDRDYYHIERDGMVDQGNREWMNY